MRVDRVLEVNAANTERLNEGSDEKAESCEATMDVANSGNQSRDSGVRIGLNGVVCGGLSGGSRDGDATDGDDDALTLKTTDPVREQKRFLIFDRCSLLNQMAFADNSSMALKTKLTTAHEGSYKWTDHEVSQCIASTSQEYCYVAEHINDAPMWFHKTPSCFEIANDSEVLKMIRGPFTDRILAAFDEEVSDITNFESLKRALLSKQDLRSNLQDDTRSKKVLNSLKVSAMQIRKMDGNPEVVVFPGVPCVVYDVGQNRRYTMNDNEFITNRRTMGITFRDRGESNYSMNEVHIFLDQVFPNEQDRRAFLEYQSFGLTDYRQKRCMFHIGVNNNGKSTVFELLHSIWGSYSYCGSQKMLTKDCDGTSMASLGSRRHCFYDDMDPSTAINSAKYKQLTGSGLIHDRMIYAKKTNHNNLATMNVSYNAAPPLDRKDTAMMNRTLFMLYPSRFVNPEDPHEPKVDESNHVFKVNPKYASPEWWQQHGIGFFWILVSHWQNVRDTKRSIVSPNMEKAKNDFLAGKLMTNFASLGDPSVVATSSLSAPASPSPSIASVQESIRSSPSAKADYTSICKEFFVDSLEWTDDNKHVVSAAELLKCFKKKHSDIPMNENQLRQYLRNWLKTSGRKQHYKGSAQRKGVTIYGVLRRFRLKGVDSFSDTSSVFSTLSPKRTNSLSQSRRDRNRNHVDVGGDLQQNPDRSRSRSRGGNHNGLRKQLFAQTGNEEEHLDEESDDDDVELNSKNMNFSQVEEDVVRQKNAKGIHGGHPESEEEDAAFWEHNDSLNESATAERGPGQCFEGSNFLFQSSVVPFGKR